MCVCVCVVVVVGFVFVEAASEGLNNVLEVEKRCARRRRERPQDVRDSGEGRAEQSSERAQSLFIVVQHRNANVASGACVRQLQRPIGAGALAPLSSSHLYIMMATHSNISARYSRLSHRGGDVTRPGQLLDDVSIIRMSITPPRLTFSALTAIYTRVLCSNIPRYSPHVHP